MGVITVSLDTFIVKTGKGKVEILFDFSVLRIKSIIKLCQIDVSNGKIHQIAGGFEDFSRLEIILFRLLKQARVDVCRSHVVEKCGKAFISSLQIAPAAVFCFFVADKCLFTVSERLQSSSGIDVNDPGSGRLSELQFVAQCKTVTDGGDAPGFITLHAVMPHQFAQ